MKKWIVAIVCVASLQSCAMLNDSVSRYSYHSRIKTCSRFLPQKHDPSYAPAAAAIHTQVSPGFLGPSYNGQWSGDYWSPFDY